MKTYVSIFLIAVTMSAYTQDFSEEAKKKMAGFDFLVGEWEGEGWEMRGPETRSTFTVKEQVHYDLDSTILVVRGKGEVTGGSSEKGHLALAVISYDPFQRKLQLHSWIRQGMNTKAQLELKGENGFTWWFEAGPQTIRYTMILENGEWKEIGEFSKDSDTWIKFMEMRLRKK